MSRIFETGNNIHHVALLIGYISSGRLIKNNMDDNMLLKNAWPEQLLAEYISTY